MRRKIAKVEPVQKKWLSAREAKAYLDCSDDFMQKLRDNALIRFSTISCKFYYELRSLERLIEKNIVV